MQLNLLDYTPPLEPQPEPAVCAANKKPNLTSQNQNSIKASNLRAPAPFTIGDIVRSLPRINGKGEAVQPFKGRSGIVVAVRPQFEDCKVHFGVSNHPSVICWDYLQKSDDAPHFWPSSLDNPASPVCWVEWRYLADRKDWYYTGTMGLIIRGRHANTALFPAGVDPNVVGAQL